MLTLEVIGAGFGRTGTTSLKKALEILGFNKCYHMIEVFKNPGHAQRWEKAMNGEETRWCELFAGYQSAVDWPVCTFYEELMALYPGAKVILTVRESERWYQSTLETIYRISKQDRGWLGLLIRGLRGSASMVDAVVWHGTFGGRFEDKAHAIGIFERHNEHVKRNVPVDKLLIFQVQEGWEPLCAFLNVPVPDGIPFPHANDRANFERTLRMLQGVTVALPALGLLLLLGSIIGFIRWRG